MAEYISISELNGLARKALDICDPLQHLIVLGEISGFVRHHKSGHCYFSLRDDAASVRAVMFKDKVRLLGFAPQDGMQVLAWGHATLYEKDGSFQFYAEYLRPFGVGAAQKAFDALKSKLQAEGLFDAARKRPLPVMPCCIGVVTSLNGAAFADVCSIVERRWPLAKLLVAPVHVQGIYAQQSIAEGIRVLDEDTRTDVIIVTRGGGSKEDLWVYNSEIIARAAAACQKPLVSAVGHEIDFTILDYIADRREPTPTAAAMACVPDKTIVREQLFEIQRKLQKTLQDRMNLWYNNNTDSKERIRRESPKGKIEAFRQASDFACDVLIATVKSRLHDRETSLQDSIAVAAALDPFAVLSRGYTLLTSLEGSPTTVDRLHPGQKVALRGQSSWAVCAVEKTGEVEEIRDHARKL